MSFISLDVETANWNPGSICQIGIAFFIDGQAIKRWSTLINPEEEFNSYNIAKEDRDWKGTRMAR